MASRADIAVSPARAEDLAALIAILAQDELGGHGDQLTTRNEPAYRAALAAILADPASCLLVARDAQGAVLGLAHAHAFAGLSDQGARIVQLVSLFVGAATRGTGVGARLLEAVEGWARDQGATFLTLTSNKARLDAHRFYRARGYEQRHEGFKKRL